MEKILWVFHCIFLKYVFLQKPDSARARPSTLINSDFEYRKIFSLYKPIDIYLKAVQIMKAVETFLKPENCNIDLEG
jgi:hypothetical protein